MSDWWKGKYLISSNCAFLRRVEIKHVTVRRNKIGFSKRNTFACNVCNTMFATKCLRVDFPKQCWFNISECNVGKALQDNLKNFCIYLLTNVLFFKHKMKAYFQYFSIVITLLTFHTNNTLGFLHKDFLFPVLISLYHIKIALLILHPNIQWTRLHAPQGMCECES